ncbi:MAG TPA: tubulin-like doman-containing protein, partial [Gemmataceae bacterium]|nr:tubulin-like doman-containing protein [Gemmataceae bacterium]
LAIVYQELLTGLRPFPGTTPFQLALQHTSAPPMLDVLPAEDRPAIARGLAKKPEDRFARCSDMVASLLKPPQQGDAPAAPAGPTPRLGLHTKGLSRSRSSPSAGEDEDSLGLPTEVVDKPAIAKVLSVRRKETVVRSPLVNSSPAQERQRPTLFLGIGGVAGITLQRLRERLTERFGNLDALPALQFLLVDTDRDSLRRARAGESGGALKPEETLLMPLFRPSQYRPRAKELVRWVNRRWLFAIPNSLKTEGLRPLGRLALVDNSATLLTRLRAIVSLLAEQTAQGGTLQSVTPPPEIDTPRICIVASISGGTGSGMLVDVVLAVRHAFAEMQLSSAEILGFLAHATTRKPAERDLARVNSFAALSELGSFCSGTDSVSSSSSTPTPGPALFNDCYLVQLGEDLEEPQLRSAADGLAEYLYLNTATPAQEILNQYRQATQPPPSASCPDAVLRTFGLSKITFPAKPLAHTAAEVLCKQFVGRWRGALDEKSIAKIAGETSEQIEALGLSRESLTAQFHTAMENVLGDNLEVYFRKLLGKSPMRALMEGESTVSKALSRQILNKIEDILGATRGEQDADFTPTTVFQVAAGGLARKWSDGLGRSIEQWLVQIIEDPTKRVKSAVQAIYQLQEHFKATITETESQLRRCRDFRTTMYKRLLEGEGAATGKNGRWFGAGKSQEGPSDPCNKFVEYWSLRILEACLENALKVLGLVSGSITPFAQDLTLCQQKLGHLANTFKPASKVAEEFEHQALFAESTAVFPDAATGLVTAAERVLDHLDSEFITKIDREFQDEVLTPNGGLWEVLCANADLTSSLKPVLQEWASSVILDRLKGDDAAKILTESPEGMDQAKQTLLTHVLKAEPRLQLPLTHQHLLLGLPAGAAGESLGRVVTTAFPQVPTTVFESARDVVICQEVAALSISKIADHLAASTPSCIEHAKRVMTQSCYPWAKISPRVTREEAISC